MKIKLNYLIFLPILLQANFSEIIKKVPNSYLYKLSQNEVLLAKKSLNATKALNYGKIDLSYTGIRFFNQPKMKMTLKAPVAVNPLTTPPTLIYQDVTSTLPMSDKTHFIGEIKYSYPVFTGFAISGAIEKEKIKLIKSKLKLQNTKRVIILNAAKLYSLIYALKETKKALEFEKKALKEAKEKVEALFKEGLVDKSEVELISAKYYETLAKIKSTSSNIKTLKNTLKTLLNVKSVKVDGLEEIDLKNLNPQKRPDVMEVAKNLDIAKSEEILARSNFYPKVALEVALKREADNFSLTKNDYQNIDKSYIGVGIRWNLFNGGADREKFQMAKIAKLQAVLYYKNYLNEAKTDLKNDLENIDSLKFQLKAAREELKARRAYYEKIKAKFAQGLADSVDLNDALAKFVGAKAKVEYIKSQLFFYKLKAALDGGENF